jgi:thymidylate synthase (FAD)
MQRPSVEAADEILGRYFPVLDMGYVALVDYMGGDASIDRAARTSYGAGTRKTSDQRGLIRTLRRNTHTSPSEMCEMVFHCAMPMFVARQWIRHRTASVSEYSGRYSLMPLAFYTPEEPQFCKQSKKSHQGRSEEVVDNYLEAVLRWNQQRQAATSNYEWLTDNDVARELARIDLPLSTYTQWYWKIDLHNLLHFLTLRVDSHAQYEIQVYGKIMAGMLKRVAPLSYEAWIDYNVCGSRMSRMEMDTLRKVLSEMDDSLEVQENLAKAANQNNELSSREKTEFLAKFLQKEVPDFELDLSRSKDPSYFEERFAALVPAKEKLTILSP